MPNIKVINSTGNVDYAELTAVVTVGEETAKLLSKKLGREVLPGEQFDVGTLAVYHKNPIKRFFANLNIKKNVFN